MVFVPGQVACLRVIPDLLELVHVEESRVLLVVRKHRRFGPIHSVFADDLLRLLGLIAAALFAAVVLRATWAYPALRSLLVLGPLLLLNLVV